MARILGIVVAVIVFGTGPASGLAQPYSDLFVFGDSLSDVGNVFVVTREDIPVSPPYFMGRFSNGPVWVERLAERFGLELSPSLVGGTNFAFGGAETGQEVEALFERGIDVIIPSLRVQVATFLKRDLLSDPFDDVDDVDPRALYIVWGGPNDLRQAVMAGTTDPAAEAQMAVDDLAAAIRDLASAGAEVFLVPNLPNLGLTPEARESQPDTMALATDISVRFNNALDDMLDMIEAEFGVTIFRLDVFSWLQEILAHPATFGFTQVTDPCLDGGPFEGGMPCATPAAYLFWDTIHPTAAAHAILADLAFMATMPPLTVTPGEVDLAEHATISGATAALPVLQALLQSAAETIRLDQITVAFTEQMGDEGLVDTLQVRLINDANGNAEFDATESVLAMRQVPHMVEALEVEVIPPVEIAAASETHLLVLLDVNAATGAATTAAAVGPWLRAPAAPLQGVAVLLAVLSLTCWPKHRRQLWWRHRGLFILIVVTSLGMASCGNEIDNPFTGDSHNGGFRFTVEIPADGISGEAISSGQFSQPAVPIVGSTLTVSP